MSVVDFEVHNHGSLFLLVPSSDAGKSWAEEHLPDDAMTWGDGVVVEPRYINPIVEGIVADGLVVV